MLHQPVERGGILRARHFEIVLAEHQPAARWHVLLQQMAAGDPDTVGADRRHHRITDLVDVALAADAAEAPEVLSPVEIAVQQHTLWMLAGECVHPRKVIRMSERTRENE